MSTDQSLAYPIVGPVVLGSCLQLTLYGVLMCTYYNFFSTPAYKRTTPLLRWTIHAVVFLTSFVTALYVHDLWYYSTLLNATLTPLLVGTGVQTVEPLMTGLVAVLVQTVLIVRGARLIRGRGYRLAYFIVTGCLAVAALAGSCFATAWSVEYHFDADPDDKKFLMIDFPTSLAIWMWSAAACDAAVSGLYIFLLRSPLKDSNEISQGVIRMLVSTTLRSASYTTVLAVLSAIMSESFTLGGKFNTNCIPYAFWLPLPSLYALSLFTTMSAGDRVQEKLGKREELEAVKVANWEVTLSTDRGPASQRRSSGCTRCDEKDARAASKDALSPV